MTEKNVDYDDFYPYGQVMPGRSSNTANANDIYKFTGHERDAELGLDYMLARNYDPEIGRFLSVDPLYDKYPGLSPYMYVEGNPLRLIDPDGMQSSPPNGWLASGRVGLGATYGTIGNVIKGTIEAAQSFFSISSNVEVMGSTIASANIEVTGSEATGNNVSGSTTVLGSSNSFGEPNKTDVGDNYNLAVDFKKMTIGVSENQNGVTKYSMDFQHGPTKMGGSVSSDGTIEVRQNTDVSFDFGNFAKGSVGILNKLQINVNKGFEKASETLSTILGTE